MTNRNEIDAAYKWDFSAVYKDSAQMEAELAACRRMAEEIAAHNGALAESAEKLLETLELVFAAMEKLEKASCYAFLQYSVDGSDTKAQEMLALTESCGIELMTAMAFMEPEILTIPEQTLRGWLERDSFAKYRHYLSDVLRVKAHMLDAKGEALMAKVSKITGLANDVYTIFTDVELELPEIVDEKGEKVQLTGGNFGVFRESGCRSVREAAFRGMFGTYKKYNNTFAALYAGSVKKDNMNADIRGYRSACEAALFAGNVPVSVYDSLIGAVHDALPAMQKYLHLRQKVLQLEEMDVFDLYCPMTAEVEYPMPYEAGKVLVKNALKPLGEAYTALLERAFSENWIDVYETPGKHSGAYSMGVYGVHPYILLNYTDTLDDAFTLAHELGHAMHSHYSNTAQDFVNHDYKIMAAEVASTVNEVLLTEYLLAAETDPRRRAYILNHFLEGFRTTVFRQTLFAEFERKAHEMEQEGIPLTADALNNLYAELEQIYYSAAKLQDVVAVEWSYIPHFYRAFYVYQYATGFCAAVAIASRLLKTGDASGYLHFLTTGGSDYPLEELKLAGVDLTSPAVVTDAMKVFADTIDELAACLSGQTADDQR